MGRAFTPTRSAIFGSPERAAAADIAGVGLNFVMGLGQDEIEAENRREISNASIALQKEWDGLRTYMNLNAGRPDLWPSEFQKRKAAIRQGVLSGARQPAARKQIQLETDERLSAWSGEISNRVSLQIARNANTDFEAGLKRFLDESRSYDDRTDMYEHLENALTHIEDGHDRGMDLAATPEQLDLLKRAATRKIIGDYLVAEATLSGDSKGTAIIEHANTVAHQRGIEGNPFGPDDLEDLKKRFKAKLSERQASEKLKYDAVVKAGVLAIQEKLYQNRDFTDIRKFIDEKLPPDAVQEREHWYDKADALAKAELSKEDSPFEKTMNPAKKEELLEKATRDDVTLSEIEQWVGKKDGISISDGQEIRRVLEDDAHIFKTSQVKGWFSKLNEDFGGEKQDPVRAMDYADQMRKFFLDYERRNQKLPSNKEIEEFYDKNFVEPGIKDWMAKIWTKFNPYSRGRSFAQRLVDWAQGKETPQENQESQTGTMVKYALEDPGRPANLAEFKQAVKDLNAVDPTSARAYYEKWWMEFNKP